jgi:hypothetical protein
LGSIAGSGTQRFCRIRWQRIECDVKPRFGKGRKTGDEAGDANESHSPLSAATADRNNRKADADTKKRRVGAVVRVLIGVHSPAGLRDPNNGQNAGL